MSDEATTRIETARTAAAVAHTDDDLDPLVGTMLGPFRIDGVLGRGGFGVVYRAWDSRLDRPVALKALRFDTTSARARFRREARAQARLRHRNAVPVHSVEELSGITCLVMDLVQGETLRDLAKRQGKIPEARALEIIEAVASALSAAQERGIIHRDVKPSNILIEPDGHVLLADFGLAHEIDPEADGPRSIVGTPAYLAPEQARGEPIDHRADIYALGVTFYELLSGERPPPHAMGKDSPEPPLPRPLRSIDPSIRPEVEAVVHRMIARDPDERHATYKELLADLSALHAAPPALLARVAAYVLDFVLFGAIAGLVAGAIESSLGTSRSEEWIEALAGWPTAAVAMAILESAWGTSLGKRLLRLRTVDADGKKPRFGPALVRSFVKLAPFWIGVLFRLVPVPHAATIGGFLIFGALAAIFAPALGSFGPGLHDRLARTNVVRWR